MENKMRSLDLFSGYGGITLALQKYVAPIAYVEIEDYAQKIIAYRMAGGSLPRAPIFADVKNIQGQLGVCDIITGGFPCQDISVAGRGAGLAGERSGLFYEVIRLTKEIRPPFVFLENVPAIRTRGLEQVIKEFTEMGYDCRWTMLSAASVGAPHKRERWFMLARATSAELQNTKSGEASRLSSEPRDNGEKEFVANTDSKRLERQRKEPIRTKQELNHASNSSWWTTEPNVGRVAHGTPFRIHRLKALGNGVVPLQVRTAFELLLGISKDTK